MSLSEHDKASLAEAANLVHDVLARHLREVSGQAITVELTIKHDIDTFTKLLDAA